MRKPFDKDWRLSQEFGNKLFINGVDIYAQFGLKGHNGLDYALPTKTPVLAPHSGKVVEATNDPNGYGNYLKIENDREGSVLAHLDTFAVGVGEYIQEGGVVGYSDNTGNSTAPHLHWGYYRFPRDRSNGYVGFIDQTPFINQTPTPPPADLDRERGIKVLDEYRKVRVDGAEGNFEGYIRALVGRDGRFSTLMGDLSVATNKLEETVEMIKTRDETIQNMLKHMEEHTEPHISAIPTTQLLKELINRFLGK